MTDILFVSVDCIFDVIVCCWFPVSCDAQFAGFGSSFTV